MGAGTVIGARNVAWVPATDVVPTRAPMPEVAVERLPDLEVHEEGPGRPRGETPPPPPIVCSECGVPNPTTRKKCLSCGKRL